MPPPRGTTVRSERHRTRTIRTMNVKKDEEA